MPTSCTARVADPGVWIPQALYDLQRGPVLGAPYHPDERAVLATLLLNAAPPLAGRLLSPALFVFDAATGGFAACEPVDTVLAGGAPPQPGLLRFAQACSLSFFFPLCDCPVPLASWLHPRESSCVGTPLASVGTARNSATRGTCIVSKPAP